MGRHASKLKHNKKVSIKQQRKIPKPSHHDPKVQRAWTHRNTLTKNYSLFGLTTDVNRSIRWERDRDAVVEIENAEEPQEVTQPEPAVEKKEPIIELDVPEQKPSRPPRMSHREIGYTKALIDKYGDNYKAMARDIKLNFYQHTKSQLKKMCELYNSRYAGGRFDRKEGEPLPIAADSS